MTSNVHDLAHLVDDVIKFGELQSFSAYPFENMLGYIKRLLRNGRNPLAQVAKRLTELTRVDGSANNIVSESSKLVLSKPNHGKDVPLNFQLTAKNGNELEFYSKIEMADFVLSTDTANRWFLTQKNEIVCLKNILSVQNNVSLFGSPMIKTTAFFEKPIKSSALHIYAADFFADENNTDNQSFDITDIKCKLVRIQYDDNIDVFIPLLHTRT